jgi:ABC-type thiamin/hydroxymethylpyrimidine transport system permease subunit
VIRIPDLRWVVRFAWALAAPAWFVWLAYEDRSLNPVMWLSAIVCVAFALAGIARWRGGKLADRRRWLLELMGIGLLTGALVAPVAVLLILVKISLHSHGTPDFTAGDIAAVMNRAPVWALAGVLSGEALGLIGVTFSRVE